MLSSKAKLDDYRPFVGDETIDRIANKADTLRGQRVVHMNSTYHAGGVVEILLSLVGLQNQLGYQDRVASAPRNTKILRRHQSDA